MNFYDLTETTVADLASQKNTFLGSKENLQNILYCF